MRAGGRVMQQDEGMGSGQPGCWKGWVDLF